MTAVALGAAGGCSSPSPSDGTSVSFSKTLMPLFQSRCSTSQTFTCHGDRAVEGTTLQGMANQPRPFFGPAPLFTPSAQDISDVYTGLKNKPSSEAPTIDYVVPGDPNSSFLWLKVNGGLNAIMSKCTSGMNPACGLPMPNDNTVLSPTELGEIQSWIQGGAPNN
jgi:hypothetical protein